MKTILNSRRHQYAARVGVFLIIVALIAGMVGCGGGGAPVAYDLTIASSAGGSVTNPGEGTSTHDEGEVVNLEATPDDYYRFVNWSGDVGTIADISDTLTTITMNGDYSITANFEGEEAVTFLDPNLEAAIRQDIGKPEDPIYASDLTDLTSLVATERNIAHLTGLEYCTSLTLLALYDNQISDISPLADLTSLTELLLYGNQISDISPLANLTGLTLLHLSHNQIGDISPLASLTGLTDLSLWENQISDISPLTNLTSLMLLQLQENQIIDISSLANLTSLTVLYLHSNQTIDISSLANLTSLTELYLHGNQISDISPLVDNEGLAEGDTVVLILNPLSSDSINTHIPQLEARGVIVEY